MNNFKKITLALFSIVLLFSCVKDDVEDFKSGAHIVGFKKSESSYIYTSADVNPVQVTEPIDLIGGSNGTPSNSNITVQFSVDASSTALQGTDYTIDITGNQITIPAGSDFVLLPITINPTVLPGNTPKTIVINLTQVSSNNAVISDANKQITITIAKCESALAGDYTLEVTRIDNGAVYSFTTETITSTGTVGEYVTSSTSEFGDLALGGLDDLTTSGAPRNGFIFNDVCQTIIIPQQFLGDYYPNLVKGSQDDQNEVTLDPLTGNVVEITMTYTVVRAAGLRKYRAVYTKL
ncbi:hypothetical protein [Flavobacterium difficile]|uniref:DUF1735 domain-containing protein n=1 Tax=Flavobacterium difficile TaxID=2709659 RepID=A0ABX0I3Z3_9FLAO|nr:hypothetical protein [Flavobacterium difficile]NHM01905.1 hypothetical protein [Flavobacterium difficile]